MINLSVGIPSKNRPISLFRCLKSINKEKKYIYEIIVSNDSESKYKNIYKKICDKFNVSVVDGPKKGLYSNHNYIYNICSGTHIRIVDDDHTFPSKHFQICFENIKKYPDEILSLGETYPANNRKIYFPGELNARGFSSKPKNYSRCAALSSGASIFPKKIFKNKIYEIDIYPFGMIWLEFGKRLQKAGINIRVILDTYVIHHYYEFNRSINSEKLHIETTFFVMLANNLIYEKKLTNFLLMIYEVSKKTLNINGITNLKLLCSALKNFNKIKNEKFWDFN